MRTYYLPCLIGGPSDGKRIILPRRIRDYGVFVVPRLTFATYREDAPTSINTHHYFKHPTLVGGDRVEAWVSEDHAYRDRDDVVASAVLCAAGALLETA